MRYRYCFAQKKVVPAHLVQQGRYESEPRAALYDFTSDEMPPTRHPVTGEYFTSKKRFRAVTKARGYEEVGTAYDNGYDPGERLRDEEREGDRRLSQRFREVLNEGNCYRHRERR